MSVTITYSTDPLQLTALIAAGWKTLTLWYANSPDGVYANTNVTPSDPSTSTSTLATLNTYGLPYVTTFAYSAGNPAQWFKVVPYNGAAYAALNDSNPFQGGGGTTLQVLRQHLGDEIRDMRIGTLTTGTTSTSAVLAGTDLTRFADSFFNSWFLNDTTQKLWAPIGTWTNSTATATVPLGITGAVSGDSVELTRRFTPDEYRKALNWAIVSAYPVLNKTIVNTSIETQVTFYRYEVPQDIISVSSVEIESGAFISNTDSHIRGMPWKQVPFRITKDGLYRTIELGSYLTPGRRLRIIGTGPMSQLYNDSDFIEEIEPQLDLLVYFAAYRLYRTLVNDSASSDIDRYAQLADHYMQRAQMLKDSYAQSRPAKRMWSEDVRGNTSRRTTSLSASFSPSTYDTT